MGSLFYFYKTSKDNKEQEAFEYALKSSDPKCSSNSSTNIPMPTEENIARHTRQAGQTQGHRPGQLNAVISGSKSELEAYLDKYRLPHKQDALHKID